MRAVKKNIDRCFQSYPHLFSAVLISTFFLSVFPLCDLAAQSGEENETPVTLNDFKTPEYGEHSSDIPELMIYGKKAVAVGSLTYLTELRLEWLDGAFEKIKATITTPDGIYDKTIKIIKGDKHVHFQSDSMTVEGIGFVADQKKKTVHISSNAKVVLIGDLQTLEQKMKQDNASDNNPESATDSKK
jgi:hypothetical protein